MINRYGAVFYAIAAAVLYALCSPISKLIINVLPPNELAGLLYIGAGIGMTSVAVFRRKTKTEYRPFNKADIPFIIGMVVLDIAAPLFVMNGLARTTAENVSLLNNFEIVATSLIAFFIFREKISKKLALSITLVTLSSVLLSFDSTEGFSFSVGSLFIIAACICWGFENNCTRRISDCNPIIIVAIKGIFSGFGALTVSFLTDTPVFEPLTVFIALVLGFFSYGMSIFLYIKAQRTLGAAKTSAFYATAPFVGVFISLIIFRQIPSPIFFVAFAVMVAGTYLAVRDR